jgi:septum formation topological specificity factor MinE
MENQEFLEEEQEKSLQKLEQGYRIAKDVDRFATIMDKYGVDVISGLIPALGDWSVAGISGAYLIKKGNQIDLDKKAKRNIIITKIKDALIGTIPVIGDIFDYFYKSNIKSAEHFHEKVRELEQDARAKGVPEDAIQKLKEELKIIEKYTEHIHNIQTKTKKQVTNVLNE